MFKDIMYARGAAILPTPSKTKQVKAYNEIV